VIARLLVDVETQVQRSDRWAVESRRSRNWWPAVAAVLVAAGYAVAVLVAASARGSFDLSDDAQVALVGTAPSLGVIGALLAFVGTRRTRLVALSWLVFVLGVLLVVASLGVLGMILMALNDLS
jgi:hypothetical protein